MVTLLLKTNPFEFQTCNNGQQSFPSIPPGRPSTNELECDVIQYWKGSQHGAVMKIDEDGNMEWFKAIGEEYGEMWGIIQAKQSGNGKYIFTCGRGGTENSVKYRYLDNSGVDQETSLSPTNPCDFNEYRYGRKFYIAKLDGTQQGQQQWSYTYGLQQPGGSNNAYALPGEAYDLAEAGDNGIIAVGCNREFVGSTWSDMLGLIVKINPADGKIIKMRKIALSGFDIEMRAIESQNGNSFAIVYEKKDLSSGISIIGGFKIDADLNDISGSAFGLHEYNSFLTSALLPTPVSGYNFPTFNHAFGYKVYDIEKQSFDGNTFFFVGGHSIANDDHVYDNSNDEGLVLKLNADMSLSNYQSMAK